MSSESFGRGEAALELAALHRLRSAAMFPLGPPRPLPHAACRAPATVLTYFRVLVLPLREIAGAGCGWEAFAQHRAAARFGGLPACADASRNLANPVHLDVCM
eukprot:869985-Prymnesium_polylepis.1